LHALADYIRRPLASHIRNHGNVYMPSRG
jgi:hypothetical protein